MHVSGEQLEAEARQRAKDKVEGTRRFVNLAALKRKAKQKSKS